MKKIALSLVTTLVLLSCKNEAPKDVEISTNSVNESKSIIDAKKATMKISGMTCAIGCAKTIEDKLKNLEGVQKASVDFESKTATVDYDADLQSIESITKFIESVADGKTYKVSDARNI